MLEQAILTSGFCFIIISIVIWVHQRLATVSKLLYGTKCVGLNSENVDIQMQYELFTRILSGPMVYRYIVYLLHWSYT